MRYPGKKIFEKFKGRFKETFCARVLFSMVAFWMPLLVNIALLLVKAGFKTYCEPAKTKKSKKTV